MDAKAFWAPALTRSATGGRAAVCASLPKPMLGLFEGLDAAAGRRFPWRGLRAAPWGW